jgi:hypothetical protein
VRFERRRRVGIRYSERRGFFLVKLPVNIKHRQQTLLFPSAALMNCAGSGKYKGGRSSRS